MPTKKIVAPEVDLEELYKIAISRLKNSNPCDKDVHMHAVNIIATDNIQSTRSHSLREFLRSTLTKRNEFM